MIEIEGGLAPNSDPLGAADQQACADWEDNEGQDVVTLSGIWHAAIAYERKRVALGMVTVERALDDASAARYKAVARIIRLVVTPRGPVGNGRLKLYRFTGVPQDILEFGERVATEKL